MSDTAALVNMLTFGRILAENLDKKAETDLQHAWKAEQLKLEKDKLTLSKEKMDADLIQDQSSRRELGVGSIKYIFTYTISSLSGTVGTFRILGGSGQYEITNRV